MDTYIQNSHGRSCSAARHTLITLVSNELDLHRGERSRPPFAAGAFVERSSSS